MRILAPIALIVVVVAAVLLFSGGDKQTYKVRAIFDNAGFVIPGEDVKVAGVKVGKIDSLDVTDDNKAVVVLDIQDKGYQDFRKDAECTVRPQSLIGERFVECKPTQARQATAPEAPALAQIKDGPGKGQYLLPLDRTRKPVDLDLIGDITREPERARLSIILNELGTGVAGRGSDLNDVIRRADPALLEVDKVLKILASENRTLRQLAVNGDTVLAPLARERRHVSGAISNSADVAEATAERSNALEADVARLPRFLTELKPTMQRLGGLADQATPVFAALGAEAPAINRVVQQIGPFSTAATPAVKSLGEAAKVGTPAVIAARPVIGDLRVLAKQVRPVASTAAALLSSLQRTKGFERLLDYAFYQVAAVNGFDSIGHYLRAGLIVNQCSSYAINPTPGCSANFVSTGASATAASAGGPRDNVLLATAEALRRALAGEPAKKPSKKARRRAARRQSVVDSIPTPEAAPKLQATPTPAASATPAPATAATPVPTPTASPDDPLLDFLFGKDPQ
jgi:phospholipid/cholesterol/gamma-HCH transport system substrate-binding protein